MNYNIPPDEVENVLYMYWQLLLEVEFNCIRDLDDHYNKHLVESAYKLLHRSAILDESIKPDWIK